MSRNTAIVPKPPAKRITARRPSSSVPGVDRPWTHSSSIDRKCSSQEALPLKPTHKLGHIPEYLRKGSKSTEPPNCIKSGEGHSNRNIWEEKCQALEEKIVLYREQSEAQQRLIASLQERVAQLDTFVQETIPTELKRLCSEIETREEKIQGLERSMADQSASKLDLLYEEVRELRQLVQQPADVFQYYGDQLNSTVDLLTRSYRQLLAMVEKRRTDREFERHSDQEDDHHRNFYRQKMRLDKRNRHTQIRVKKYDG